MIEGISAPTMKLLIASFLRGVGKATLWTIASDPLFYRLADDELADVHSALKEFNVESERYRKALARAEVEVEKAISLGIRIIGFSDPEYPASLRRAPSAPAIFWYRGDVRALGVPNVAVIGTRQPTRAGEIIAARISSALGEHGFCVASGLALGVDAIAHKAAVMGRKPTVAILAGGLDSIQPKRNAPLAESIVDSGGGLFSEFPIGVPSLPTNFVIRDSTQAAISAAVVLVQSDTTGGSLHASRACVKLRRRLYVVAPIAQDMNKREPKIQANLGLLEGRLESMHFPDGAGDYIFPLAGKDDYPELFEASKDAWASFSVRRMR